MFIHIQDYLDIPRNDKLEFFVLLGAFKNFKVTSQKIVLNDNSLLLQFDESSDISFAKEAIERFFEKEDFIKVSLVKQIKQSQDEIVLVFEDEREKRIKI